MWHAEPLIFLVARQTFSSGTPAPSQGMWDLLPCPGIERGPPALGAWSLSHWTTWEVPEKYVLHNQHAEFNMQNSLMSTLTSVSPRSGLLNPGAIHMAVGSYPCCRAARGHRPGTLRGVLAFTTRCQQCSPQVPTTCHQCRVESLFCSSVFTDTTQQ